MRYRTHWKRAFDLALTLLTAPVWVALCGVVALAVLVFLGRPVLFFQDRPGLHARTFRIFKFRSMALAPDAANSLSSDAVRLTRFGRWLRASSLDELPSLINVVLGEMSLIGPRPLLVAYLPRYSASEARRHEVRPGLTGWAQVNGRNAASWPEKLAMDVWYVDHCSFSLDMRILWKTAAKVLEREGISAPGHHTAPEFMGNTTTDHDEPRERANTGDTAQ